jgi:hypothetical protein
VKLGNCETGQFGNSEMMDFGNWKFGNCEIGRMEKSQIPKKVKLENWEIR